MEKKQTAVELLKETLDAEMKLGTKMIINWDMYLEMEKEQIQEAWNDGDYAYFDSKETGRDFENGEQYYNEVYSK